MPLNCWYRTPARPARIGRQTPKQLKQLAGTQIRSSQIALTGQQTALKQLVTHQLERVRVDLANRQKLLEVLNPTAVLKRGYAIVRQQGKTVRSSQQLKPSAIVGNTVSQRQVHG